MLRALAIVFLLLGNLILIGTPVLLGGIVKLLTFGKEPRRRVRLALAKLAERWVARNDRIFDALLTTRWDISGVEGLDPDGHYLLVANHVSWVDIFAVFRAFHGKTAFIRFFLKQQLIWFPIVGQASWALDFPFMRRYTPEELAAHPEKRGRDLETTRIACRRYRRIPVTILNFVEGTRFSPAKQREQQSPYRFLLRPRPGGISFVLASLAEQLDGVIDVTLVYPTLDVTMWDFVSNRIPRIVVRAQKLDVPQEFFSDAITEPGPERERFKTWLDDVWRQKDAEITKLLG